MYSDIDEISGRILKIVAEITDTRDMVVNDHEQYFEAVYRKYDIEENAPIEGTRLACVMGGEKITAEFDPLLKEWFVVKARCGDPEASDAKKEEYIRFIKEITGIGEDLIDDMKLELAVIDVAFMGTGIIPVDDEAGKYCVQISGRYSGNNIRGTALIPLDVTIPVTFLARIS